MSKWNEEVLARLNAKKALRALALNHGMNRQTVIPDGQDLRCTICEGAWRPSVADPLLQLCPGIVAAEQACRAAGCTWREIFSIWRGGL